MKIVITFLSLIFFLTSKSFSTELVELVSPLGGETGYLDSTMTIHWIGGEDNDYVDIEYFNIKDNSWNSIADSVESEQGDNNFTWSTPDNNTNKYLTIRVSSNEISSCSKKYFKLKVKPSPKMARMNEVKNLNERIDRISEFDLVDVYDLSGTLLLSSIEMRRIENSITNGVYILRRKENNSGAITIEKIIIAK